MKNDPPLPMFMHRKRSSVLETVPKKTGGVGGELLGGGLLVTLLVGGTPPRGCRGGKRDSGVLEVPTSGSDLTRPSA